MIDVHTLVFDLDGTLYEDPRVYERYAAELSRFLPDGRREQYLRAWEEAKAGRSVVRIGMGYDETRDRLFRVNERHISCFVDWTGREEPVREHNLEEDETAIEAGVGLKPPTEVPVFGPGRFNIGDWWGLLDILAAHYGVSKEDRGLAFLATRAYMADEGRMNPDPTLRERLGKLARAGKRLIAMSNSPPESVDEVLDQLGIRDCFAMAFASAKKPGGFVRILHDWGGVHHVLSIGDNFVNDIEPAIDAGGYALYIDRHQTALGQDTPSCYCVTSIEAAWTWISRYCL